MRVKSQSKPTRCEICHQADALVNGTCTRCNGVSLPAQSTTAAKEFNAQYEIASIRRELLAIKLCLLIAIITAWLWVMARG